MDRYGTDFQSRGTWNQGTNRDFGRGMDRGFGWGEGRGNHGRWTSQDRGFSGSSYDEGWRSSNQGFGTFGDRFDHRFSGGYGSSYETGGYHPGHGPYGAHGGFGGQGFQRSDRTFYDREMFGRDRWQNDRNEGLGDRLRHGWHRVREEARDWMGGRGRGYDRGW